MDESNQPPQPTGAPVTTAEPIVQVSTANKEAGPSKSLVEASETIPKIDAELSELVQRSEKPVPQDRDIIKASGESVPVSTSPQGIVQVPELSPREKAKNDLKLGAREGPAWTGMEVIREEDKEVAHSRLKELEELKPDDIS